MVSLDGNILVEWSLALSLRPVMKRDLVVEGLLVLASAWMNERRKEISEWSPSAVVVVHASGGGWPGQTR